MKKLSLILVFSALCFLTYQFIKDDSLKSKPKSVSKNDNKKQHADLKSQIVLENEARSLNDEGKNKKQRNNFETKKVITKTIQIDTRDIIRPKGPRPRGAAKDYKEVIVLELEGESSHKIILDQALEGIGSVVAVSLDGPILINKFSANESGSKIFKAGQEAMKGDWVKLGAPLEALKSIEIETKSKDANRLKIYVQHFDKNL